MVTNAAFTELIQLHERLWGMDQYPNRPSLGNLLSQPIVAMWSANNKPTSAVKRAGDATGTPERFMLTTHQDFDELDTLATSIILAGNPTFVSNWKLSRLFVNQVSAKVLFRMQIIEDGK